MKTILGLILFTAVIAVTSSAGAETNDPWLEDFKRANLFTPHPNFCDPATEVFIQAGTRTTHGICIEKAERATTKYWEDARKDCALSGKRLPEMAEWRIACRTAGATGFTNNTADREWVSNSTTIMYYPAPNIYAVMVPNIGFGTTPCSTSSHGIVSSPQLSWSPELFAYRCVR
jgi:hypothetical protein